MAVTKTASTNAKVFSLVGTLSEIINALDTEGITRSQIITIFHDGTNYVAIYKRS